MLYIINRIFTVYRICVGVATQRKVEAMQRNRILSMKNHNGLHKFIFHVFLDRVCEAVGINPRQKDNGMTIIFVVTS
jgi:hypothetical protein